MYKLVYNITIKVPPWYLAQMSGWAWPNESNFSATNYKLKLIHVWLCPHIRTDHFFIITLSKYTLLLQAVQVCTMLKKLQGCEVYMYVNEKVSDIFS